MRRLLRLLPLVGLILSGCKTAPSSKQSTPSSISETTAEISSETSLESSETIISASSDESPSTSEESSSDEFSSASEETSESSSEVTLYDYTPEGLANAYASQLGWQVNDLSDEDGPYFITGGAYYASNVTIDQLKGLGEDIGLIDGFFIYKDWEATTLSDGTPAEIAIFTCTDTTSGDMVVIQPMVFSWQYTPEAEEGTSEASEVTPIDLNEIDVHIYSV